MMAQPRKTAAPHIMLIDDHPIVRRGVRDILTDAFPGVSIEDVSLGADAVPLLLRRPSWDVVILDLSLPDCSGMEVLEQIRRLKADVPVLILSMHSADQFATRACQAGAAGYLTKDAVDTELVIAVTDALSGRRYFPDRDTPDAMSTARTNPPHARLSARELQVLVALAQGKTVGDIARELDVTSKTVSTFRTRLLRKMELRTNADITKYVIQHRLMP